MNWQTHIDAIITKASSRLYFLKILKKSGLNSHQLRHFYLSVIRPILEYCSAIWHQGGISIRNLLYLCSKSSHFDICCSTHRVHDSTTLTCKKDISKHVLYLHWCLHLIWFDLRNYKIYNVFRQNVPHNTTTRLTKNAATTFVLLLCLYNLYIWPLVWFNTACLKKSSNFTSTSPTTIL